MDVHVHTGVIADGDRERPARGRGEVVEHLGPALVGARGAVVGVEHVRGRARRPPVVGVGEVLDLDGIRLGPRLLAISDVVVAHRLVAREVGPARRAVEPRLGRAPHGLVEDGHARVGLVGVEHHVAAGVVEDVSALDAGDGDVRGVAVHRRGREVVGLPDHADVARAVHPGGALEDPVPRVAACAVAVVDLLVELFDRHVAAPVVGQPGVRTRGEVALIVGAAVRGLVVARHGPGVGDIGRGRVERRFARDAEGREGEQEQGHGVTSPIWSPSAIGAIQTRWP